MKTARTFLGQCARPLCLVAFLVLAACSAKSSNGGGPASAVLGTALAAEPECGGLNQKCCPGGPFEKGQCLTPDVLGCDKGTCEPCKRGAGPCCSDGSCTAEHSCVDMGTESSFCEACGFPKLECCLPDKSLNGKACQVGACEVNEDGIKLCVDVIQKAPKKDAKAPRR